MNDRVSIVMYHYVRDLKLSKYPGIKGLDTLLFKNQVEYLNRHYQFISMELLIDAIDNGSKLPEKAVLLTFDDGYADHYKYVFPILHKLNIPGAFFPPVKVIMEHQVLDVNKIHFILAAEENKSKIIAEIKGELKRFRKDFQLESDAYYYEKLARPSRYDTAEVIFIKRLLQVELKEEVRNRITNNLFETITGMDENSFSRELYMDQEQIKCMHENGMHFGSHGYNHYWLGALDRETQEEEIKKSLDFLSQIGSNTEQWTMCYPYGNYNEATLDLLAENNCKLALTTETKVANLGKDHKYKLPRLDTNDIPKSRDTAPNHWYDKG